MGTVSSGRIRRAHLFAALRPAAWILGLSIGFLASCGSTDSKRDPEPGSSPKSGGKTEAEPSPTPEPKPGPEGAGFGLAYKAHSLELLGDYEGAEKAYRAALADDPSSSLLARSVSRVLLKRNKGIEACGVLSEHLKVREDVYTRMSLIRTLDRIGREDLAAKEAAAVLSGAALPPKVAEELADRALRKGDARAAAEALGKTQAPPDHPGDPDLRAGNLLLERGFAAEAQGRYEASLGKEPGGRARLGLAEVLARSRNWKAAAREAAAFADAHAVDLEGAMTAGDFQAKAGDLEGACARFRAAAALPGSRGGGFLALARARRAQGKRGEAAEAYRAVRAAVPADAPAAYELGTLLEEEGKAPEAEEHLMAALERGGSAPHVLLALALAWARQGKDLDRAEAAIREALRADPRSGASLAVAGYVLHREGKPIEARASFERALAADADPFVQRVFGDFLSESGSKAEEAAAAWRRAVELDPRLADVLGPRIDAAEKGGR